ncbi:MAG: TonB-dependent siderophore receptor [Pseudomonadota bacterium]
MKIKAPLAAPLALAGATLAVTHNPATAQTSDTMVTDEIIVEGKAIEQTPAGPVDGYRALSADSGTRTRTPIREIPQSIQVIPRDVIEDQQADTVSEITRNVSGVQGIQARERTQQVDGNFLVRGQFTELYLNGRTTFLDQGFDPESTINIERVEVLKGPTSALFTAANGAPISGIINLVEKTPEKTPFYFAEGTAGSFDFFNAAFDVNQPLTETLSFRVTGDFRTSNDFVDQADDRTGAVFPTLRFDNGTTAVTLRGRYQNSEFNFYNGLPTLGPLAPAPGFSATDAVAAFDQPDTVLESFSFDLLAEHQFTDQIFGRFRAGYQDADGEQNTTLSGINLFGAGAPGEIVRTDNTQLLQVNTFDVGGEVIYEVEPTDFWEHTLLLGAEYQSTDSDGISFFNFGPSSTDLAVIQAAPFESMSPFFPPAPFGLNLDTVTGIFQSQSTFFDRIHVLGGLSISGTNVETEGLAPVDDIVLSPRIGVAVDALPGLTPFVGWGRGFRTPQGVIATSAFFSGISEVAIERNEQVEVGVRFEHDALGLSGSLAFYNLQREDAAVFVTSGAQAGVFDLADQRSRGVELDLIWQPTDEFKMLANYAYTDAEITDNIDIGIDLIEAEGNQLQRVPEHSGRVALRYDFLDGPLEGLGAGFGVTVLSEQAGDLGNTFFTEGYAVFDLQASYQYRNVEAAFSIENLTDNDAFVPNFFFQGNTAPLTGRNFRGTVRITF